MMVTLIKQELLRAKPFKITDQGFGAVFYKTKTASGKTVYGQGKTSFLDPKYKERANVAMYNFEKYMMSKPESPSITINDSDSSTNDDALFGVNTTSKLSEKMKRIADEPIIGVNSMTNLEPPKMETTDNIEQNLDDFEIIFDDTENKAENAETDGGAITENYESPTIKHNK